MCEALLEMLGSHRCVNQMGSLPGALHILSLVRLFLDCQEGISCKTLFFIIY